MSRDSTLMQITDRLKHPGFANDAHLFLLWLVYLTNKNTRQRKYCATVGLFCVRGLFTLPNPKGIWKDNINHKCQVPYTRNWETRWGDQKWRLIGHLASEWRTCLKFCYFVGRICIALSTSSRMYCRDDSNVEIGCSRMQAWLGHSMSVLRKHMGAWNVIFPVAY